MGRQWSTSPNVHGALTQVLQPEEPTTQSARSKIPLARVPFRKLLGDNSKRPAFRFQPLTFSVSISNFSLQALTTPSSLPGNVTSYCIENTEATRPEQPLLPATTPVSPCTGPLICPGPLAVAAEVTFESSSTPQPANACPGPLTVAAEVTSESSSTPQLPNACPGLPGSIHGGLHLRWLLMHAHCSTRGHIGQLYLSAFGVKSFAGLRKAKASRLSAVPVIQCLLPTSPHPLIPHNLSFPRRAYTLTTPKLLFSRPLVTSLMPLVKLVFPLSVLEAAGDTVNP